MGDLADKMKDPNSWFYKVFHQNDQTSGIYTLSTGIGDDLQSKRLGRNQPYVRGGQIVTSSGTYLPIEKQNFDNGGLSLASSGITKLGSNSQYVANVGFTFTHVVVGAACTTTIYWDGTNGSTVKVIRRADGTSQTIPPNNITISGLTSSTSYGCLPFWSPFNLCQIGWVQGNVGTPQIIFTTAAMTDLALSQQNLQDQEPLSGGYLTFSTPAASGGGGGPSGGGGCVMLGTLIEEFEGFPMSTENVPCSDWWRIEAGGACVNVVPEHRFYDAKGNAKQAKDFEVGDWIIRKNGDFEVTESYGFMRSCTKVDVRMAKLHLYWANGFLSSNNKIAQPSP